MNEVQVIQNKIYEIRGQRVMLDFDLAMLYCVETRVLNQAVKRNRERFPADFMFQITAEEWSFISSQFVMTSRLKRPKSALPLAFTEHGALMRRCRQYRQKTPPSDRLLPTRGQYITYKYVLPMK